MCQVNLLLVLFVLMALCRAFFVFCPVRCLTCVLWILLQAIRMKCQFLFSLKNSKTFKLLSAVVVIMVNVLEFCTSKLLTIWHMQTVQIQIRLLLKEQSDQGLHCLPFY